MKFVKVQSLLKDIDSENPNTIQASLKKAEKYLYRKVVHYLDNNNEDVLANRGSKLINLLHSAHDSIDTATDDEIEYMLDEIKSNVKRFDRGMKRIRATPMTPTVQTEEASKSEVSWQKFSKQMKLKVHPIRGNMDIVRVPVFFVSKKPHQFWNRKVAGNPQQIRRHGLDLVEYNNYPILRDEYVMFIKKDFPPIQNVDEKGFIRGFMLDALRETTWGDKLEEINKGRMVKNEGWTKQKENELGMPEYRPAGRGENMKIITYRNYWAQWFVSPPKNKILQQYFGEIKSWGIAYGDPKSGT